MPSGDKYYMCGNSKNCSSEFGSNYDDTRTLSSSGTLNSLFESSLGELRKVTTNLTPTISNSDIEQKISPNSYNYIDTNVFIMLVGLPASGKSTVASRLVKTLLSYNQKAEICNAGDFRRKFKQQGTSSDFFDPSNNNAKEEREVFANIAMSQLIHDLKSGRINIGIFDATNSNIQRRRNILNRLRQENISCIVFDVQCTDKYMLGHNIVQKTHNTDYKGKDYEQSLIDFNRRLAHYRTAYDEVTSSELDAYSDVIMCYMKLKNLGIETDIRNVTIRDGNEKRVFAILQEFLRSYYNREEGEYWGEFEQV